MRHDWVEDLLAVIDSGSFARAAEARNISQSAFARRIEAIEQQLGGPLFDRRRKPIVLRHEARSLAAPLRQLRRDQRALMYSAQQIASDGITLACQHAISATLSSRLLAQLSTANLGVVRVRAGNRDECLMMALSGEANLVVTYVEHGASKIGGSDFVEHTIGHDALVAVATPNLSTPIETPLPAITYPSTVFFGSVVESLWARMQPARRLQARVETAFTLAAYRYAREGIGVAWLPHSLVVEDLRNGTLIRPPDCGPDYPLQIRVIRRAECEHPITRRAWDIFVGMTSKRVP
ncbi:LysR family transcriptional regulator [Gammaproteobacteria bacterium]|nr:LysR family transcriptional regulator [Gammaproteobacteria bacterium]